MSQTINGQEMPALPDAWGHPVAWDQVPIPPQPMVKYVGWWIYLVPASEWPNVPKYARRLLGVMWHHGYRELEDVLNLTDDELLATDGVGPKILSEWTSWKDERGVRLGEEWGDEVIDRLRGVW